MILIDNIEWTSDWLKANRNIAELTTKSRPSLQLQYKQLKTGDLCLFFNWWMADTITKPDT